MLLAPLRYWRVRHPVKQRLWDCFFPLVGALALTILVIFWPKVGSPYGVGGYIAGLQSLYAILGGFFVAALTLVSTSDTKALAQPLAGSPRVTFGHEKAPLNRRRFLCLLFGYLSFSCFGLYGVGFGIGLLAPGARAVLDPVAAKVISALFLFGYNFWLSHMAISTLVGLYYFTDC